MVEPYSGRGVHETSHLQRRYRLRRSQPRRGSTVDLPWSRWARTSPARDGTPLDHGLFVRTSHHERRRTTRNDYAPYAISARFCKMFNSAGVVCDGCRVILVGCRCHMAPGRVAPMASTSPRWLSDGDRRDAGQAATATAAHRTDVAATATLTPHGRSCSGVRGAVDRPVADRGDGRVGPRRHRPGRAGLHPVRGDGTGQFGFIAVRGWLDCRPVERDGRVGVEFTWDGLDEGDRVSGRGSASVVDDGTIEGHVFFHLGDDSSFRARPFAAAD